MHANKRQNSSTWITAVKRYFVPGILGTAVFKSYPGRSRYQLDASRRGENRRKSCCDKSGGTHYTVGGRGGKGLLSDPGSELRLGREKEKEKICTKIKHRCDDEHTDPKTKKRTWYIPVCSGRMKCLIKSNHNCEHVTGKCFTFTLRVRAHKIVYQVQAFYEHRSKAGKRPLGRCDFMFIHTLRGI